MFPLLAIILALMPLKATPEKEQTDSLVRLMNAQSAQLIKEFDGTSYRKVIGPASFLHNNTYLICDTAIWNVDSKIINAFGNVQILQNETVLTSEKLDYLIDDNLAQFRGTQVQLQDKDGNTLRTRFLDYNTKDSVAIFERGASFRDKDGQIIESRDGSYDSKIKTFTFSYDVNMFTDSIFVKAPDLKYVSTEGKAYFYSGVDAWKEDNMLSANSGYYSSQDSTFLFTNKVHAQTNGQEAWADSLYIYRPTKNVLMLGNAQVKDTTRNIEALANYIFYEDSLSSITLRKDAAIASVTKEKDQYDTLYVGANNVVYRSIKKCDINKEEIAIAIARLKDLGIDAVAEYRNKAAESRAKENSKEEDKAASGKKVEQQAKDTTATVKLNPIEKRRARLAEKQSRKDARLARKVEKPDSLSLADTLSTAMDLPEAEDLAATEENPASPVFSDSTGTAVITDSTVIANNTDSTGTKKAPGDSVQAAQDSIIPPPDTTKIGFLFATGAVKAYKRDLQMKCDSLLYSDLDSLARLFKNPIIWNDENRQYSSDSVSVLIKDSRLSRANLSSNAFIIVQEDTNYFDQIKGSEILAYFDEEGNLERFDALGGATAVFYIEENGVLATANKVEAKMLSALLDSNQVQRVFYFDNPKNNAFPIMQLPKEDKRLKGFNWEPKEKPAGPQDITSLSIRPSERKSYNKRPHANFQYTGIYFPGYIDEIYREIEVRDSIERARAVEQQPADVADSLGTNLPVISASTDSLNIALPNAAADTMDTAALSASADSSGTAPLTVSSDSLAAQSDSVSGTAAADSTLIPRDKWEERALKRMKKEEEREVRWAELDARDAEKAAAKEAKKLEKKRARTRRLLVIQEKQAAKNQKRLDRYIKKLEKKKAMRPLPQTESEYSE